MVEFEHEHAVLHLDEGRCVPFIELGIRLLEGGEELVLIVVVEVLGEDEGGAFGIVHAEHALHLLFGDGGELFGDEEPAVLGKALHDGLGTRDASLPPRAYKIHELPPLGVAPS